MHSHIRTCMTYNAIHLHVHTYELLTTDYLEILYRKILRHTRHNLTQHSSIGYPYQPIHSKLRLQCVYNLQSTGCNLQFNTSVDDSYIYTPEQFMQTMMPRLMTPQTGSVAAQSAHVLLEGFSWICWRISVDLVCLTTRARVCSLVSRPVRMADVRTSIHSFLSSSSAAWNLLVCATMHENSVSSSSVTNPKPKGRPSHCLLSGKPNLSKRQNHLYRCLVLRIRGTCTCVYYWQLGRHRNILCTCTLAVFFRKPIMHSYTGSCTIIESAIQ